MIIVYGVGAINTRAQKALVAQRQQQVYSLEDIADSGRNPLDIDPRDDTLTIIDLNANGNLQTMYSPKEMAKRFASAGVLAHISVIQLLVSDVARNHLNPDRNQSLLGFGTALSQALVAINPASNIIVRAPSDVVDCTVIEPPPEENPKGAWTVYSGPYPREVPPSRDGAFAFYQSRLESTVQGAIEEILCDPDYEILPTPVHVPHETVSKRLF